MATTYFLRNAASDLGGAGQKLLSTSRGTTSTTKVTSTVAAGNDLQVTDGAGGQVLEWLTGPLNTVTISGAVTVNIRGLESATAANAAAGIRIDRVSAAGAVLATIVPVTSVPAVSNEYTTADTARNASITPTSTTLVGGDRLRVTVYVRAAAGVTMGGGRTVTNSIDGPTGGAAGDSFVTFAENLTAFAGATAFPAGIGGVATIGTPTLHAGAATAPSVLALSAQIPTPARALAAFVQGLGTVQKPAGSTVTVLTLAAGVTTTVGNRVMVGWAGGLANASNTLTCDDSKGNTYTLYQKTSDAAGDAVTAIFSAPITTALVPGDTITATQSQSTTSGFLAAEEWNGLTIPAQANGAVGTSTGPAASGSVTMESGAAWFGMLCTYNAGGHITGTLGAPWTARRTAQTTSGTPRWFGTWDQVQPAGATFDFAPTLSGSAEWSASLVSLTSGTEPPTAALIWSWPGAATATSVVVTCHTTLADPIRLVVSTDPTLANPVYGTGQSPDGNGLSRHTVTGLAPATRHYYGMELNGAVTGFKGEFWTAPSGAGSFSFAVGSCSLTQAQTSFNRALTRSPNLAVITGDFPYADISSNSQGLIRDAREALITRADVAPFIRKIACLYTWSDHDFGANNSNSTSLSKPAAQAVYRQQVPHPTLVVTDAIYYTAVYGRVRFIVTDNRSFKSLQADTDNSSKTVLGATQKTWFKNLITSATEPLIFWVNEHPWVGTAGTGDDEWSNYSTERTELGDHIVASGKTVVMLSGDMHAVAYHNGSGIPGRMPVFHAAPWVNNDSQKGGPYSQGPYPASGALVRQQYGWVDVTDTATTLTVRFRGFDDTDTVRVDATLSWLQPATIAAVAAVGTVAFPTPATATPQRIVGVAAIPLPDVQGTDPSASPDTIVGRAGMGEDTEPPSVPVGLHATSIAATSIDLAWDPSTDNVAVARYEVVASLTDLSEPPPVGSGWTLTRTETFDTDGPPDSAWGVYTAQLGGGTWPLASHVYQAGGALHLRLAYETSGPNGADWYGAGMMLLTSSSVNHQYTLRYRVVDSNPALVRAHRNIPMSWGHEPPTWPANGEIDWAEGYPLTDPETNIHYPDVNGNDTWIAHTNTGVDLTQWNTLRVEKDNHTARVYWNDLSTPAYTYSGDATTLPDNPANLVLQVECRNAGCPDPSLAAEFEDIQIAWLTVATKP